ncbi:PEP-CTERM sorting domain-containing protein [Humisphaera borealis]|uniref:Ice-binding protein C-terminal domain-containing protein n=1 Tax=Humisphaera borealis TaxID=2807512 RepID=A0A7M2X112_9BACT|nr:PEP-CTERM sorting domain-containing protein [Humisphaera borealis]QOV91428.1 hypothetical protein IPV69_08760 [Humisphaera borealis]
MRFKITCGIAAIVGLALPMSSHGALVSWGTPQSIPNVNSVIASAGVTGLDGVDFGDSASGSTVVNNGSVNVNFTRMGFGTGSTALGNGISITSSGWTLDDPNSLNSILITSFGPVLDTKMGTSNTSASVTLSGLTIGTPYQVQIFSSSATADSFDTMTVSGSAAFGTHAAGAGKTIQGTFTANATTQALSFTASGGDTPAINALTIGTVPEPSSAIFGGLGVVGLVLGRRRK